MPVIRFYSTFPAGVDALIQDIMRADYPFISTDRVFENALIYEFSSGKPFKLSAPYFQNTFRIIDQLDEVGTADLGSIMSIFKNRMPTYSLRHLLQPHRSFRVALFSGGVFSSVDVTLRKQFEDEARHVSKKPIDNRKPETELWVAKRHEGVALFMLRLRNEVRSVAQRPRGRLSPQLGALLCRLSDPSPEDIFLDPFCGWGGIFLERLRWKYQMAFANDKDPRCVDSVKRELNASKKNWRKRTYIRKGDGTHLADFSNGFISAIVTDPPWGEFDRKLTDVKSFYSTTLGNFTRVLKNDGVLILLTGRSVPVAEVIAECLFTLMIEEEHEILVSGKKATIYKMKKVAD